MKNEILKLWDKQSYTNEDYKLFEEFRNSLNDGSIRAAEKVASEWQVNLWVKKGILVGFKMGELVEMPLSKHKSFFDKSTYPERKFSHSDGVRIVPGGSSIREGAFVAVSVIAMPPMYINVGAYVGAGSMIDSHALVGTCAQIGERVHLSAAAQVGGVIEPIGANPVIIEDDVFIGGNCGLYEGVIVQQRAVLAAGVIITAGTAVYDAVAEEFLPKETGRAVIIPEDAVVIPGSRPLKSNPEFSVYCPIIIKYRDAKSDASLSFEEIVR